MSTTTSATTTTTATATATATATRHDGVELCHLGMEDMLAIPPIERVKYWRLPPKNGYAFIDTSGHTALPWLFGYTIKINRWLVLALGAFSVFNDPIQNRGQGVRPNWNNPGYVYALAIFTLGMTASVSGTIVETRGPRFTSVISAVCWGAAHWFAAIAIRYDIELLMYLGFSIIGGIGLAFGYVSSVSPLLKWFPDHRGMASGFAVSGFGFGAFVAAQSNSGLIRTYGVETAFWVLGAMYFVVILASAQEYEVQAHKIREGHNLSTLQAVKTPHFLLCWFVLFANITAGVGVISQAKPIQKDVFKVSGTTADWMISIWALFNSMGRLGWSMLSDWLAARGISRKYMYIFFCSLQAVLVITLPSVTKNEDLYPLFSVIVSVLISLFGGGFGVIPAFLADLFGPENVGAVHGVVLSAWGMAGGVGGFSMSLIKEKRKAAGVPPRELYDPFFYMAFVVLIMGVISASLVRPLISKRGELRMSLGWIDTWKRKLAKRHPKKDISDMAKSQGVYGDDHDHDHDANTV